MSQGPAGRGPGPVLAVEASGSRPSVALLGPLGECWGHWSAAAGARGTSELATATQALLAGRGLAVAALAGLAVGVGPGSYTGLRASIAFVRGLAWPARLAVAGVPSFAAAARAVLVERADVGFVTVLLDARRGEMYRADYRRDPASGEPHEQRASCLVPSASVAALADGAGSVVLRDPLADALDVGRLALPILALGGHEPASLLPLYLKPSHAEIVLAERKRPG